MRKKERGFTLIELLVVIAILGVLAGIAIPRVIGAMENARRSANVANQEILQAAVERFHIETVHWPTGTAPGSVALPGAGTTPPTVVAARLTETLLRDYLRGGVFPRIEAVDMIPGPANPTATPPIPCANLVAGVTHHWAINHLGVVVIVTEAAPTVAIWPLP